jgi:heat shock protein HtpX
MVVFIGFLFGGSNGMMIAVVSAIVMNGVGYFFSDKMALASYNAKEIDYDNSPEIHQMVEELCSNANIPKPKIYVAQMGVPNAFATGRNPANASIAVTPELLDTLSFDELRGVIAHELAHIKNRDILISSIAAIIASMISIFAQRGGNNRNPILSIIALVVAPLAASIIQMAISRNREFLADEIGAKISNSPMGLANALRKLQNYRTDRISTSTAHMMIINQLDGGLLKSLFSTHPDTNERIRRLEMMR